ncbi:MAG: septation protein SepH, partial [Microbacterium sp.]
MEQLRVVGTEEGSLVLASPAGERFALAVDEVLRAEIRRARGISPEPLAARKASPREIQAQIRAGLSAEDVAELLGAAIEDVRRYEPPVIAEREFIVGQALSVPVLTGGDFDDAPSTTFGVAVRAKLAEASASAERWSSWKEPDGWIVKLLFTAGDVERDARWSFDPRRSTLTPLNADATQLSRQGSLPDGLIPRLRALDTPGLKDDSRFDSGAFGPRVTPE